MSSSNTNDQKRDFAAGVYLSEAKSPESPLNTHCIRVYSFTVLLIHTRKGGGGGESWTRDKSIGETVHKAGSKIVLRAAFC